MTDWTEEDDLPLFYVPDSETSEAAAELAEPSRTTQRQYVYRFLYERGATGATDEEIQDGLAMNPSTERPRRIELVHFGQVADSGERRLTKSGRRAVVWKTVEHHAEDNGATCGAAGSRIGLAGRSDC